MKLLYKYPTQAGEFYIGQSSDGRYHSIFEGESLGSYSQPWQVAEDLASGATFSITGVDDVSALGIPEHHSEWEKL